MGLKESGSTSERSLFELGLAFPRADWVPIAERAAAYPNAVAAMLKEHRVVGIGLARLEAIGALTEDASHSLQALRVWRQDLDSILLGGRAILDDAIAELQICVRGIKGASMQEIYPHGVDRDAGDLDLIVADVDVAWCLASWLLDHGFDWCEYEWPWIKRDSQTRSIYGQFQLWRQIGDKFLRYDIHFGGYSVRASRLAPVNLSGHDAGYQPLHPKDNLACLLGNAAGDYRIRLKDINDITVLVKSGIFDVEHVKSTVEELGLETFWRSMVEGAVQLSALDEAETTALQSSVHSRRWSRSIQIGAQSARRRAVATAIDAYQHAAQSGQRVRGFGTAGRIFRYYSTKHAITVLPCSHRHAPKLLDTLRNEECVRLIPSRRIIVPPVDERPEPIRRSQKVDGSEMLYQLQTAGHVFLGAGEETFIPTINYDLCQREASWRLPEQTRSDSSDSA